MVTENFQKIPARLVCSDRRYQSSLETTICADCKKLVAVVAQSGRDRKEIPLA